VKRAYDYFGRESVFPHTGEYNPVEAAKLKLDLSESNESSEYRRLTIPELREVLSPITHFFALTVILLGFKLGMRQGEIRNVRLQDIHLRNSELQNHYETLGTHPRLTEYQNSIYIPSRYERPGNKSHEPRVLPLDDEMRHCLTQYLLIRPDCGESEVFVSQTDHERIRDKDGINRYWRRQIRPQIEIEEHHDEITSHFGRHYFTTYWKVEQNVAREYVQYMRGDKVGKSNSNESIDEYLHAYYEDIEELYREEIYKLLI
jgi:integrase/recombinase XerD